jgi:hypothetical protein
MFRPGAGQDGHAGKTGTGDLKKMMKETEHVGIYR